MTEWLDVGKDFGQKMKAVTDGTSHEDMGNQCSSNQAAEDGLHQHVHPQSDKEKAFLSRFLLLPPCLFSLMARR